MRPGFWEPGDVLVIFELSFGRSTRTSCGIDTRDLITRASRADRTTATFQFAPLAFVADMISTREKKGGETRVDTPGNLSIFGSLSSQRILRISEHGEM